MTVHIIITPPTHSTPTAAAQLLSSACTTTSPEQSLRGSQKGGVLGSIQRHRRQQSADTGGSLMVVGANWNNVCVNC